MRNFSFVFLLSGLALFSGCSKSKDQPTPLPDIDSIAPMNVPVGTTVVVSGTNFSSTPANNQLTFNGVPAVISNASSTQLTAIVPAGAFTDELRAAEVRVTSEGRRSVSPAYLRGDNFPEVTSIEPSSGPVGTIITIRGRNFNKDLNSSAILFFNSSALPPNRTPLFASSVSIQIAVPTGTGTGDVCLMTYVTPDKSKYLSDCSTFTVTP